MITDPAVDVDGADRGLQAFAVHDGYHLSDALWGQIGEFTVVDGNVGFAARTVAAAPCTGHVAFDTGEHLLQAGVVFSALESLGLV